MNKQLKEKSLKISASNVESKHFNRIMQNVSDPSLNDEPLKRKSKHHQSKKRYTSFSQLAYNAACG